MRGRVVAIGIAWVIGTCRMAREIITALLRGRRRQREARALAALLPSTAAKAMFLGIMEVLGPL
jgi:hypothetical protein